MSAFNKRLKLLLFGIAFIPIHLCAQVYNTGTVIRIEQGATMRILGDYADNSSTAEPNISLAGTLRIDGNIQNNSTGTQLIRESSEVPIVGTVILGGTNQSIGGNHPSFFPNLTLQFTGGLILNQDIIIDDNLTFVTGQVSLNGNTVFLTEGAEIIGESSGHRFNHFNQGNIEFFETTIEDGEAVVNHNGSGFGFNQLAGSGSVNNFQITRFYLANTQAGNVWIPNVVNQFQVANGMHVLRLFNVKSSTTEGLLYQTTIHYYDAELNGITEDNMALYYSHDGGTTWIKASGSGNAVSNTYTANNIPMMPSIAVPEQTDIILALAANICSPAYTPASSLTYNLSSIASGATINICEGTAMNLSVPTSAGQVYAWTRGGNGIGTNASIVVANVNDVPDEGNYNVFIRNQRGCEAFNNLSVMVRDIPVPSFGVSPNPDTYALCDQEEVQFTAGTTAEGSITAWAWTLDNVNNVTSVQQNPVHTYAAYGEYVVNLNVTTQYGCSSNSAATRDLEIHPLPQTNFRIEDLVATTITEICEDIPVQLVNTSTYTDIGGDNATAALSYSWNFGYPTAPNLEISPQHTFFNHNTYSITLTATAPTLCSSTYTADLIVNPEPVPNFNIQLAGAVIDNVCAGIVVDFNNQTTMPDATGVSYAWDFNDGGTSTALDPSRQFTTDGAYNVILTATSDQHGCFESSSMPLTIHPVPQGSFNVIDTDICLYEEAAFTNESFINNGTLTYAWSFGDGQVSSSSSPSLNHTYNSPQQFTVILNRTSDQGCSNSVSRNIKVHPTPVVGFVAANACDGETINFYNTSVIQQDQIIAYEWDFADQQAQSQQVSPQYQFSSYGLYSVSLTAISDWSCQATAVQEVQVYRNPEFNLGAVAISCEGEMVLDPSSDPLAYLPAGSDYVWQNNAGLVVSNNETVLVNQTGQYQVEITSPEQCTSNIPIPVFIFQPLELGTPLTACEQTVLDAEINQGNDFSLAENTQYQWSGGGEIIDSDRFIQITETADYQLTITRQVAGETCETTDNINVQIEAPIVLNMPTTLDFCEGETLLLQSPVVAGSYSWLDNNQTELSTSASVQIGTAGNYSLLVANAACQANATFIIEENPLPQVSFQQSAAIICEEQSVTVQSLSYINGGSINNLLWDFGDGTNQSSQVIAEKTYSIAGNYLISLTAFSDQGCSASASNNVLVNPNPIASFTTANVCVGTSLPLTNSSTAGASYSWSFGDGDTSNEEQPSKTINTAGDYEVLLEVEDNGCVASYAQTISIYPNPVVAFPDIINTCGESLLLSTPFSDLPHRWFDPSTDQTLSVLATYLVTDDRQVGVTLVNEFGCESTEETSVDVLSPLTVDIGQDREVCDGEVLDVGFWPGAQILWSTGEQEATIEVLSSGTFSVQVVDQNGCEGSDEVTLEVRQTPEVTLPPTINLCEGQSTLLEAPVNQDYTYQWSTGETSAGIQVSTSGLLSVIVSNGNCFAEDETLIVINPVPQVEFSVSNSCEEVSLTFQNSTTVAGSAALTYQWNFGDGTLSSQSNPIKSYQNPGTYAVVLNATSGSCSSQQTVDLQIWERPQANFVSGLACPGAPVSFVNTSTFSNQSGLSYLWSFGNGTNATLVQPTAIYNASGNYQVQLQVTSPQGCMSTINKVIEVGTYPSLASWKNVQNSCYESIQLNAGNPGSQYLWSDNSTGQTLQVISSGIYAVSITDPSGCSVTAQTDITFDHSLQTQLPEMAEACEKIKLDPLVNVSSYLWSTGERSRSITVNQSGQYWLQLVSSNLCIARDTVNVTINPLPLFDLGNDLVLCDGDPLTLQIQTTIPSTYLWSSGQHTSLIQVNESGSYTATALSDKGCSYQDQVSIRFNPLPVWNLPPSLTNCGDYTLTPGDLNPDSAFLWSDGSTSPSLNVINSGNYSVVITTSDNCSISEEIEIVILTEPVVELGPSQTLCYGESTILNAGSGDLQYNWSTDENTPFITVTRSGIYSVEVTAANGCSTEDDIAITVRPPFAVSLGEDRLLCNNEGITLTAPPQAIAYAWTSTNGFASTERQISITTPGTYTLTVRDIFNCSGTDEVRIQPTTQNITANFLVPSTVDQGNAVHFVQLSEPTPTTFQWSFGDGSVSSVENPVYRYFRTGEFRPRLIVSNGVCRDTLIKVITVRAARTEVEEEPDGPQFIALVDAKPFPNPFSERLDVEIELTAESEVLLNVFTLDGVLIKEQKIKLLKGKVPLDMSQVSDGVYLLQVIVNNKTSLLKIMKVQRG